MDEQILPYDILRFDYKERLSDRFLATHLHRFEMFSKPVALLIIVEIVSPWHPASELGQKIINSLVREFLRAEAQSFLARFEIALKQANQAVKETLDQTKSPVSCVAVLLETDQVHCAGIGTSKLGLLRNGRLATILGAKSTYAETFTAVTSGDMIEGDWLLMANDAYYAAIVSVDTQSWLNEDITDLGLRLSKLDQKEEKFAGVLLRYNHTSSVNQAFLWGEIDQSNQDSIRQPWLKVNSSFLKGVINDIGHRIRNLWQKHSKSKFHQGVLNNETSTKLEVGLNQLKRRRLPVILTVLVIIIVIWLGYFQSNKNSPEEIPPSNLLTELQNQPINLLWKILNDKFDFNEYQSLDQQDKTQLISLLKNQKIFLVDLPDPTIQTAVETVAIEAFYDRLVFVDTKGQLWTFNDSRLAQTSQNSSVNNPVSLAALNATNIVVTDSAGNVWYFDGTNSQPKALTQTGEMASGTKLAAFYKNNLYLINSSSLNSYRVNNFSGNLSGIAPYNKAQNLPEISIPTDVAINGQVIVADNNGQVASFAKNSIAKKMISLPFVNGLVRVSSIDGTALTLVNSGRAIYLLDDSNTLVGAMFIASKEDVLDIALDPSVPSRFWVATGDNIYNLSFSSFP